MAEDEEKIRLPSWFKAAHNCDWTTSFLEVPGGWLYAVQQTDSDGSDDGSGVALATTMSICFVPFPPGYEPDKDELQRRLDGLTHAADPTPEKERAP